MAEKKEEGKPVIYEGIFQSSPGQELKALKPSDYTLKIYQSSKTMTFNDGDANNMIYLNEWTAFYTPTYHKSIFTLDVNNALGKGNNVLIEDNQVSGQRTIWRLKA